MGRVVAYECNAAPGSLCGRVVGTRAATLEALLSRVCGLLCVTHSMSTHRSRYWSTSRLFWSNKYHGVISKMVSYRQQRLTMRRVLFLAFAFATALNDTVHGADNSPTSSAAPEQPVETSSQQADTVKIRLTVNGKAVTATLIDSETTRDFISLLPLTLTMNDLFRREKFAHLPRAISKEGKRMQTYEVGDIAYWSPGPDVAIFYRHDGQRIPNPGIIIMGKLDSGTEALGVPGSVLVRFERLD